jgi:prolyl 4-hydroxylase
MTLLIFRSPIRYEEGQFYRVHHDYVEHNLERQQGVRILTVFLYLSEVEAGGGTNFDRLNITVMPKRGRALFWPSVLNSTPHKKDGRTTHQALPVEAGIKYAANAWFHQVRRGRFANVNIAFMQSM